MCQAAETRTGTQTVSSSIEESGYLGAACGQQGPYGIANISPMDSTETGKDKQVQTVLQLLSTNRRFL